MDTKKKQTYGRKRVGKKTERSERNAEARGRQLQIASSKQAQRGPPTKATANQNDGYRIFSSAEVDIKPNEWDISSVGRRIQ